MAPAGIVTVEAIVGGWTALLVKQCVWEKWWGMWIGERSGVSCIAAK